MAEKKIYLSVASTQNAKEKQLMGKVHEMDRRISELIVLKPEVDKLRSKIDQAEINLKKSHNKVTKYEQKNTKLEESNKKLSLEKVDLQHRCAKLSGQCRFNDSEITKLTEQNHNLNSHLNKAVEDVRLYQSQCSELREKVAEAAVMEKAYHILQNQFKKLTEDHGTCLRELEKLKTKYREKLHQFKDLENANDAAEATIKKLRQDIEKKQTQIKLVEQERDDLKEAMEKMQNTFLKMQSQVKNVKELKEQIKTKEYENVKINQVKDEDIMHLHTALKNRETSERSEIRKVEALTAERLLLSGNLFTANKEIGKMGKENSILKRRIQKLLAIVKSQTLELEKGSMKIGSLEKQLAKMKRQEEAMRLSEEQHNIETQQEIDMLTTNVTNLEKHIVQLQMTNGVRENEIHTLRKQIDNLESLLSQTKTNSAEHQSQANFFKGALNEHKQLHYIMLKKVARQVNQLHKPKSVSFKRKKGQYQWTRAVTEMLNEYKLSGNKQVKILHQPCANVIKQLRHENDDLKSRLSRRPDKPYEQVYWCKKDLQKSEERVKVLKAESQTYYDSWLKEREEKDALQQEARKLRSMVKKQPDPKRETKETKHTAERGATVFNRIEQVINVEVKVVNFPSAKFESAAQDEDSKSTVAKKAPSPSMNSSKKK